MTKSVLSIGQCGPDESTLTRFLQGAYDVRVKSVALKAEALSAMKEKTFDLVLINRKLDSDYSDGLEIIREMKQDDQLKNVPVMLISNFAESQKEAVAEGALYGFGKLEYSETETKNRLSAVLE